MRKQKKYTTRSQITNKIDGIKTQHQFDCVEAEGLDKEADALFVWINEINSKVDSVDDLPKKLQDEYLNKKNTATKKRAEAKRIRKRQPTVQRRIAKLTRTPAAFDTEPMPFVDRSVVQAK